MVRNELIQEILALETADLELIHDVVVARLSDDLPPKLSPEDQQEMLRRIEAYDKDPASFLSWDEVKAKLAAQRAGNR